MKRVTNTSLLLSAFLCGAVSMQAASGESAILNITNSTSKSYGTYEGISIYSVGDTQNGGAATQITLGGANVTATLVTGSGSGRGYLTTNSWNTTYGLPSGVNLGIDSSDVASLLSEGVYTKGSGAGYPGIITLTFAGLNKGVYDLSALMAKTTGDLSATTFSLTLNSAAAGSTVTSYQYTSSGWTSTGSSTGFEAMENNKPGAAFVDFSGINVTENNSTLVLKLTGTPTSDSTKNLKSLQFVTLTYVPEPATATLSLLALVGLAARRRRRPV